MMFCSIKKLFLITMATVCLLGVTFSINMVSEASTTSTQNEALVRIVFANDPVMVTVAQCESRFRQFTDSGNVLRASGRYVGIFQIDEQLHVGKATALGFDIYTPIGNIAYAKHLYDQLGSQPWTNCAKKHISSVQVNPNGEVCPMVRISMRGDCVTRLQSLLNDKMETQLATDGVFGKGTLATLKDFQTKNNLIADGVAGAKTWTLLNK